MSVWGEADKAILESVDNDRRGKLGVPSPFSENNFRKLKIQDFSSKIQSYSLFKSTHNFLIPDSGFFCLLKGASSGS